MTTIDHTHAPSADEASTEPAPAATPAPARRPGLNTDTVALGALFVAIFAFLAAIVAIAFATRAIDEAESVQATPTAATQSAGATAVSLTEFSISPDPIEVPAGSSLAVTNDGSVAHNLVVEGSTTPMLNSGDSASLDVSSLAPGSYAVFCDVSGHRAAGMETTIEVG